MSINRRNVLTGAAAAAAVTVAQPVFTRRAGAQAPIVLQWWVGGGLPPEQKKGFDYQIKTFEDENPGVKVNIQAAPDEKSALMLSAAFASKQLPNIVTHLPSHVIMTYGAKDLLLPMEEILQRVGPEKFYPGIHHIYETKPGSYMALCSLSVASDMLWVRRDLMEKAGVTQMPRTWDELRSACQKMQTGGVYGAPLPYAKNSMTTAIFMGMVHRAGGRIFTPDLEVALDSQATLDALEFYASMRELCPPGATGYTWQDSLAAFVAGASATAIYSGRVLTNVYNGNPRMRDFIACDVYPTISKSVDAWTFNSFGGMMIPKEASNMDLTKKLAVHLYRHDGYMQSALAGPGHHLPVIKSVIDDPVYKSNVLINKYDREVRAMMAAATDGFNLSWESPKHGKNVKAGEVTASGILGEEVQRVCLNKENPKAVVGDACKKIEAIMKAA